ncbi:GIY-YIG nuclease family protein [Nocardioides dilutus]
MPFTYILECADGSYYCGSTWDLERRLMEHNNGVGCSYTRPTRRRPAPRLVARVRTGRRGLRAREAAAGLEPCEAPGTHRRADRRHPRSRGSLVRCAGPAGGRQRARDAG